MKRGEPLKRTTPLKRTDGFAKGKGLARSALKRTGGLKPKSAKRQAGSADRKVAVEAAFKRDGWRLVAGRWVGGRCIPAEHGMPGACFGHLTPHRLKKGSAGGGYTLDNIASSCAMHNDLIEDEPDLARGLGLVL